MLFQCSQLVWALLHSVLTNLAYIFGILVCIMIIVHYFKEDCVVSCPYHHHLQLFHASSFLVKNDWTFLWHHLHFLLFQLFSKAVWLLNVTAPKIGSDLVHFFDNSSEWKWMWFYNDHHQGVETLFPWWTFQDNFIDNNIRVIKRKPEKCQQFYYREMGSLKGLAYVAGSTMSLQRSYRILLKPWPLM